MPQLAFLDNFIVCVRSRCTVDIEIRKLGKIPGSYNISVSFEYSGLQISMILLSAYGQDVRLTLKL